MIRRRKKLRSKKLSIIFILFFGVIITLVIVLFFRFNPLTIKQIEVNSNQVSCTNADQIKSSVSLYGKNFFRLNSEKSTQSLKAKFICLQNVHLSLVFPNKVKIEAVPRQPAAILISLRDKPASPSSLIENIATPSAQQFSDSFVVDSEGAVFSKDVNGLNTPKIYTFGLEISLGKFLQDGLTKNSLKILDKIKTFGIDNSETWIMDDFLIINGKPKIIFRLDEKTDIQLASLQLILAEAKIDLKELEFVDLRYDKPIVKYTPKK